MQTQIIYKRIPYAVRIKIEIYEKFPRSTVSLRDADACDNGKIPIIDLTAAGKLSKEKNVPHKNDMGVIIYVLNLPIS